MPENAVLDKHDENTGCSLRSTGNKYTYDLAGDKMNPPITQSKDAQTECTVSGLSRALKGIALRWVHLAGLWLIREQLWR